MNFSPGKTFKFLFLPNFKRSFTGLSQTGGMFTRLIALMLADIKLIPRDHPLLMGQEKGLKALFGLIREAGKKIKFDRAHAIQTVMFFAIIGSMAFLVMTALTLLLQLTLGIGSAFAQTPGQSSSMFLSPAGGNDLALQWIREVFGTDGAQATSGDQAGLTFLRGALISMLGFYSSGMLVLASIILLYYLIRMVVETAHHGVPFGKSHNMVWSPIRLVFALMLLIPVGSGLNTGQYMVLNIARWGSGLASNAWVTFSGALGNNKATLAPMPVPDAEDLIENVTIIVACTQTMNKITSMQKAALGQNAIKNLFGSADMITPVPAKNGDTFEMTFGTPEDPHRCGGISFEKVDTGSTASSTIYNAHIKALTQIVDDITASTEKLSTLAAMAQGYQPNGTDNNDATLLTAYEKLDIQGWANRYRKIVADAANAAVSSSSGQSMKLITDQVTRYGWASAGFYFLTLSRMNEQYASAVSAIPKTTAPSFAFLDKFTGKNTEVRNVVGFISKAIEAHRAQKKLVSSKLLESSAASNGSFLDNLFSDMLKKAGLTSGYAGDPTSIGIAQDLNSGLFKVSETNPISSLITLGRWLQGVNLTGLAISTAINSAKILGTGVDIGGTPGAIFAGALLSIGFGAGFALAYILPLIPFLKFFFGILAWLAVLFEAIVLVPLWALGHLNTEGEGLPGPRAANGYMILLNLFLKPIMMIFGLIGSLMLFMIGIKILNFGFSIAVGGVSGASWGAGGGIMDFIANTASGVLSPLSLILYVIIYCVIAYSIANSCFNLIDTLPEQCLRWIGGPTISDGMDETHVLKAAPAAMAGLMAVMSAPYKVLGDMKPPGGGGGSGSDRDKKAFEGATASAEVKDQSIPGRALGQRRGGTGSVTQAGTNPGNRSIDVSNEPGLSGWENQRRGNNPASPQIQPPSGNGGKNP